MFRDDNDVRSLLNELVEIQFHEETDTMYLIHMHVGDRLHIWMGRYHLTNSVVGY